MQLPKGDNDYGTLMPEWNREESSIDGWWICAAFRYRLHNAPSVPIDDIVIAREESDMVRRREANVNYGRK